MRASAGAALEAMLISFPFFGLRGRFPVRADSNHDGSVVIRIGGDRDALLRVYASVEPAGVFDNPWAMPGETGQTLWLCRGRRRSFEQDWASFRNYR